MRRVITPQNFSATVPGVTKAVFFQSPPEILNTRDIG